METYSVKQIAEMLKTKPETVRRWIRNGKLYAEKSSRKEGHVVTEKDLNNFLKSSPKYAGIAAGIVGATVMTPIAAIPVMGGIAATYLAAAKKNKTIGDDTILWSGNHVGHHSKIGSHCFLTSHVVVSGVTSVGDYTFIGVNASVGNGIRIAEDNLIGAGAVITKDTQKGEVYVPQRSISLDKKSHEISID